MCFGIAVLLFCYWGYSTFTAVPEEDRTWLDRPPLGFRLVWPLIRLLMYYFSGFISIGYRQRTLMRLAKAGIEFNLSPGQFFFGKVVGILVGCLMGYLLGDMLAVPPWGLMMPWRCWASCIRKYG